MQVLESFEDMQRNGINSIPVLVFEVLNGVEPARVVHHGSGSAAEFTEILQRLYTAFSTL